MNNKDPLIKPFFKHKYQIKPRKNWPTMKQQTVNRFDLFLKIKVVI